MARVWRHRQTVVLVCVCLFVCFPAWAQQTTPPRDNTAAATGNAIVRGRVTAAATGRPLHRVRLTLNGPAQNPPTAVTDTRGRFEIANVPPGTYTLTAVRAGYLSIQYGQRRPREAGRTIQIAKDQTLEGIDLQMFRGGVLAGRVLDEVNDPAPGIRIEAIESRYINGRRLAVPAAIATTNDIGEYRITGLNPGLYQIRASSTDVWESDDGATAHVHGETFFPGVTAAEHPQAVALAVGQVVAGIDFALIASRAARITGIIEDANGAPLTAQVVNLDRIGRTVGGALAYAEFGGRAQTDAAGGFEIAKLPPGEYQVYFTSGTDTISERVILRDGDTRHVVLTPSKPASVKGVIVSDEDVMPAIAASRVSVVPVALDADNALPAWDAPRPQTTASDWTFRFTRLSGEYLFRLTGLPDEWMLKSVTAGGRDVTDTPVKFARGQPEVSDVRLLVSRKGARLTGRVTAQDGKPTGDATIVLFAEQPASRGVGSRFVRAVRPDDAGAFAIGGIVPATYYAAAVDFIAEGQWEDPDYLQSLASHATRIELKEGMSAEIVLALGPLR